MYCGEVCCSRGSRVQCIGGQEAGLKVGPEVNMDEEGTGSSAGSLSAVSRILFYTECCVRVCASVRTNSQSNGFVALNDWQQGQQQRLSDGGAAVGLRPFPSCIGCASGYTEISCTVHIHIGEMKEMIELVAAS